MDNTNNNTIDQELAELSEKFPFLSGIQHLENFYIGIIQNSDDKYISFYDFKSLKNSQHKDIFLQCGDCWWWESSRILPINIFMPNEMAEFRYCLKTLVNKDIKIVFGPCTSLNNMLKKRIKRRQVSLIRKIT
ncbi:hypothetical protein RVBP17_1310 [Pseudomonas phage sp. 30-3]|uniref:Uncharacterized protein n=1 Tax=Pseudomonas phage vB_PaeM_PA5oct TaxID=2163605 RepID=A0A4Y5JVL2_9CAUD|nr:hypothetical protein PQE65_gp263 [Pseudomonas phage vB_PaeM_PA5oct]WMI31765.1 hypothetical protein GBBBJNDB_00062 [Pseudomonas phage Callisto]WPK38694.1 hypothetical protein Cassandra_0018 [Pseudomonas phage Cassandra]WPK39215.1 hypothetical protein Deiofobo_0018 [Pseudomonas phage Deifobo]WPK39727.1 hypothetical protein ETTORE_0018 [Pseudomonas phage Ettore]WPK40248.1 hypothetical protein Paride_0018 [Pseudomonas phage Paride]VOH53831.1 hypothetical protein MIJ3_00062 [Pseudomonas phage v